MGVLQADGDTGGPDHSEEIQAAFTKLRVGDKGKNPVKIPRTSDMIVAYSTVKGKPVSIQVDQIHVVDIRTVILGFASASK